MACPRVRVLDRVNAVKDRVLFFVDAHVRVTALTVGIDRDPPRLMQGAPTSWSARALPAPAKVCLPLQVDLPP